MKSQAVSLQYLAKIGHQLHPTPAVRPHDPSQDTPGPAHFQSPTDLHETVEILFTSLLLQSATCSIGLGSGRGDDHLVREGRER
jgi:hypothetical protein